VLVALTLALVSLAGVPGKAEAATCLTCHAPVGSTTDIRPVESTYRNITTGSIIGSHAKHIPAATINASACNDCHGSAASSYITNHRNGFINVTSAVSVGYSKKTSFPQSGSKTITFGTCNTATCHENGKGVKVASPTWGTAAPACTACHALVPGDSHTQHVTGTTYKKAVCADCHTGYVQGTTAAANHINGTVEVTAGGYPSPKAKGSAFATCATSYCHSSGQSANGTSATPVYATVTWGGTIACGSCHATTTLATGTHAKHLAVASNCDNCHGTNPDNSYPSTSHVNGLIDVINQGYSAGGAPGNGYGTCSTSICHSYSTTATPVWGTNTTNDTCTVCHGTATPSGTITSANRHVVAPSDPTATDTGKVSSVARTGAHQTHLQFFNGLSSQGTEDDRCIACHGTLPTSGLHNAQFTNANPNSTFSGLATKSGTMVATYSTGSCSNTYCHNPAGSGGTLKIAANAGTGTTPLWTDATYLDTTSGLKTDANCNKCHLSPGNAAFAKSGHPATIASDCAACHGHNGGAGGTVGKQHMDGVLWGSGSCNTCHGYQAGSWATAPAINAEGKGAHEKHIVYLTSKRFTVTLAPATDSYASASASWTNVCGICHGNTVTNHQNNIVNVALDQTYLFGTSPTLAQYNGTPGTSSGTAGKEKTCSNISCHYFTTPVWSTY
jgi:predicted CxxxxCH...CXXCH cytochrome family protein